VSYYDALSTVPVLPYSAITGEEERRLVLGQHPALRELAAKRFQRIHVQMEGPQSTVIAEQDVNVNIDCLPWYNQFPGGDVQWFKQMRDQDGKCK